MCLGTRGQTGNNRSAPSRPRCYAPALGDTAPLAGQRFQRVLLQGRASVSRPFPLAASEAAAAFLSRAGRRGAAVVRFVRNVSGGGALVANLALPVLAADAVAFPLGFPAGLAVAAAS